MMVARDGNRRQEGGTVVPSWRDDRLPRERERGYGLRETMRKRRRGCRRQLWWRSTRQAVEDVDGDVSGFGHHGEDVHGDARCRRRRQCVWWCTVVGDGGRPRGWFGFYPIKVLHGGYVPAWEPSSGSGSCVNIQVAARVLDLHNQFRVDDDMVTV
ncbi:hypothetical protein L1987_42431 [Smallanthus sonchifolius]|uniref:Uncharacterized protein n=1 Tax=Smallanthus sonchifolius TaxID=185202 RepID=A0ACB9GIQ5_9ASTR|nr:hypothetical protein L1987_42431 [Smallanthus sonchifolius]